MISEILLPTDSRFQIAEIRREFVSFLADLNAEIVLDGIDLLHSESRLKIRSHDALGMLPEVFVEQTGNLFEQLDRLDRNIAKLVEIAADRRSTDWAVTTDIADPANSRTRFLKARGGRFRVPRLAARRFAS